MIAGAPTKSEADAISSHEITMSARKRKEYRRPDADEAKDLIVRDSKRYDGSQATHYLWTEHEVGMQLLQEL